MTINASLETQLNNLEDLRLPELQACYKQVVGKASRAPNRKFLIRKIREAAAAQEDVAEPVAAALPEAPNPAAPENPAALKKASKPAPAKKTRRTKKKASAPVAPTPEPEPTILTGPLGPITVGKPATKKATTKKAKKAPIRVAPPQPESTTAPPQPEAEADEDESTAPPRPDLKALSVNDLRTAYVEEVGRPTKSTDRNYLIWKIRQARKGKVPVGPVSRRSSNTGGERRVLPLRMHPDTIEALDDVWRRHGLSSRMDMFRCALDHYLTSLEEHEAAALARR